jgi:predicted transcriptional regulator
MATTEGPEPDLKERARELRRQGLSVSQIADSLGRPVDRSMFRWVADLPVPEWTRRPNAKDETREAARDLRLHGWSLQQIATHLAVSKASVSVWVRDLPVPEGLRERAAHAHRINSKRWLRDRAKREEERQRVKREARSLVGELSDRELMLAGAVLYWAEGAKDKPYARRERVSLINSDPQVIVLFQRWLDLMNVPGDDRRYRLSIHESADLEAAHSWWSDVTGVPVDRFAAPTIKRHNPKTVRLNVGDDYHGCLVVSVRRSRILYQTIEGLFRGLVQGIAANNRSRGGRDATV